MEALDPLEFHDDVEVALPEVVCDWQLDDAAATPRHEPPRLLPVVAPSPPKPLDEPASSSPPSRRRKYSAVASLFVSRRASEPFSRDSHDEDATPPILAALEAVSLSPDRGGACQRSLEPFRFAVATEASQPVAPSPSLQPSPPRPRGRVHSAVELSCSPLELRTPVADPASSSSPRRQRRSTRASSHGSTCSGSAPDGSCQDQHGELRALDATASDAHAFAVRVAGRPAGTGFRSAVDSGARWSGPPDGVRGSPPRVLPPIAVRSCERRRTCALPAQPSSSSEPV